MAGQGCTAGVKRMATACGLPSGNGGPAGAGDSLWYVPAAVRGSRRISAVAALSCAALLAAGCGGGDERQDANEPEGDFQVEVLEADFATDQTLADDEAFTITVRNTGEEQIPNLAVTLNGFSAASEQEGLADPSRPIWVVDSAPEGGDTALVNTWALGELAPGATETFRWDVTPVVAGTHMLDYRVSAGLDGKAKAVLASGEPAQGNLTVTVADEPAQSRVDPETGGVIRGGTGQ